MMRGRMERGIPSFNRDCQSAICVYIYTMYVHCTYNKYNYFDVHTCTCTLYVTVYTCTCIIHNITWYYPTSVYTAFPLFWRLAVVCLKLYVYFTASWKCTVHLHVYIITHCVMKFWWIIIFAVQIALKFMLLCLYTISCGNAPGAA